MLINSYNEQLVASWINCMLFMLELVLAVRYFQHSSRPPLHRAGIAGMLASDMLCTFTICARIYQLVSLYPSGIPDSFPDFILYTTAVILCTTYATSSFAKLFLCVLYFNLTNRRVICAILVFGIAFQVLCVFVCIGDFNHGDRVATRLGHASIQSTPAANCSVFLIGRHRRFDNSPFVAPTVERKIRLRAVLLSTRASHTPTTTPKLNTITGKSTTVFLVNHTPADDQAVIASHLPANSNCNAIHVHLTSAAQPNIGPNRSDCNPTVGTPKGCPQTRGEKLLDPPGANYGLSLHQMGDRYHPELTAVSEFEQVALIRVAAIKNIRNQAFWSSKRHASLASDHLDLVSVDGGLTQTLGVPKLMIFGKRIAGNACFLVPCGIRKDNPAKGLEIEVGGDETLHNLSARAQSTNVRQRKFVKRASYTMMRDIQ
ncbi:hypothetical protein K438DRAFT_2145826 [Mycena galopus ATCC 62051]|nr:hypothetical protein K438DRAFT_2145826 [Mycena galopus ATCC 62051]